MTKQLAVENRSLNKCPGLIMFNFFVCYFCVLSQLCVMNVANLRADLAFSSPLVWGDY